MRILRREANSLLIIQGRNWVILRGGGAGVFIRRDEIIIGLRLSVICVASLFGDMIL